MKKVITYGTFDLLHQGHINLLKRAKELGDYLIVGVTTDNFDIERGKLNTLDNLMDRIEAVKATGLADKIIIEEYQGQKIDDILAYGVDIFAIGSDWTGQFDYLKEFCDVVYLPRTAGISSTQLRACQSDNVKIGLIGSGSIANRFVNEASFVSGNEISGVFNIHPQEAETFAKTHSIPLVTDQLDQLFDHCDAVYIASPHFTHYEYIKKALLSGKHVLSETPFVLKKSQAEEVIQYAKEHRLILMLAHKTAYCPGFGHLISMLKSGVIGEIVEVNASITTLTDEKSQKLDVNNFGGSMNENACFPLLPIFKLFGTDFENINFYSKMKNGVDMFTKAVFRYKNAVASFQIGLGVKTEGNMVISGTKGYAYVPAPWWKTDFFEFRYEDQNLNRKCFYPYVGEGLRYEIKAFTASIISDGSRYNKITSQELIKMSEVQELYNDGINVYKL